MAMLQLRRWLGQGDLWLVAALFGTILLLILPVPPFLLDGLLASSVALSFLTLLVILSNGISWQQRNTQKRYFASL